MKPRSSYSKTAFILLFSVFLVAAVTKAKSSLPDITLEQAKEINADIIVLGTHGRNWLDSIIMGNDAKAILKRTMVPLFVVPIKMKEEEL